jgi:hypothetical protein
MGEVSNFLSLSLCTPAATAYGKSSNGAIAERNMVVDKEEGTPIGRAVGGWINTEVADGIWGMGSNDVMDTQLLYV